MCILFVYVADNPQPNSYKVILAVNRDEMYKRPTKEAMFWGTVPNVVGGRDMEPGREGGTWLAMSETGKIGALLNVLQSKESYEHAGEKKGRGSLVNNFVQSSDDALSYMNKIFQVASDYNPFSLLTVDVLNKEIPHICYYTCCKNNRPVELSPGTCYGIGNSFIETPYAKVKTGKEEFSKIVAKNNDISKRDNLITEILNMLKDEQSHHPDPQIISQGKNLPETFLSGLSKRFVKLPGYGTRTHTIILIDYNNKVFYKELTMTDLQSSVPEWNESVFEFDINEPAKH